MNHHLSTFTHSPQNPISLKKVLNTHTEEKKMGSYRSSSTMAIFLFMILTVSSALDMSIIGYDKTHGDKSSWRTDEEVMSMYEAWLVKHGKTYNALGEKERRFEIFKDNLRFIDEHNSENRTYTVGLNRFADLTNEEYRAMYLGAKKSGIKRRLSKPRGDRYETRVGDELPESVDWRKEGAVVDVKDQGSCGKTLLYLFIYFLNK